MTKSKARGLAWGIAAAMTAVLFACAFVFLDMRYANNDDTAILHMFQGYMNGAPATFVSFLHGLLVWPLYWLGSIAPAAPWYSYLQLGLLALSCVVMGKSIIQLFVRSGAKLWGGVLMAAAVLACFGLRYASQVSFTHTAALLGAAAVLQMMSIEHDHPRKVVTGLLGALALVCLSYALREEGVLAVLAVCGLVYCYLFLRHYGFGKGAVRSAKPMLASLLVIALVMGGLAGWRAWEVNLDENRAYAQWQDARSRLMDYYDLSALPQEAIDAAGWDPDAFDLFLEWNFMDESITTESFVRALEVVEGMDDRTAGEKLSDAWALFVASIRESQADVRCMALGLAALVWCLAGAAAGRDRRGLRLGMVLALTALLAAMLLYLSLRGRLPARAILMAALPVSAALIGLLPECLPAGKSLTAVLLCACYVVSCVMNIVPEMLKNEELDAALGNAAADLEEYALNEPDGLFITDSTLSGADSRLFPEYPDGVPDNITFWGGWQWGSPQSREQWARFGVDLERFDPAVFVDENLYIASGRMDPPPERMLAWLRSELGDDVQCDFWGENGTVYFFYFYQ